VPAEDVVVAGYPKWSAFFRGEVDREQWARTFGLDPSRKTVVYLSTWAHHSSLDRFAEAVAALGRDYNVLYKPHHNNLHFEGERFAALRQAPGVRVETEERNIVPFLAVADLALADVRSGALTEAFLADRPAVGLSPRGDLREDNLLDGVEEAAPLLADPAALAPTVARLLADDPCREGRRRLARRLFTTFDGRDDEVTAAAIQDLVRRKRPAGPRP
jgi:hypothetical protein